MLNNPHSITTYDLGVCKTPLIPLPPDKNGNVLLLKMESQNPIGHSAKARSVAQMLIDSDVDDLKGKTIVESSSGNTVLALAEFGEELGFKTVAVVDKSIAKPKLDHLIKKGVEIELVNVPDGADSRICRKERVKELRDSKHCIWLNQYDNHACAKAHRFSTASEIFEQTDGGKLDFLVAAIGTGGTIVGTSRGLKDKVTISTIAVQPKGSCIFGGVPSTYRNFGAGNDRSTFWERDVSAIDSHLDVTDDVTINNAFDFYRTTGIPIGLSAAMAYEAIKQLFAFYERKTAVLIVPDSLENYFSLENISA